MPATCVDGNNVAEVFEVMDDAVARARAGGGPSFVEARTYRWREHCGPAWDDHLSYRNIEEAKAWMARDPIRQFENRLLEEKLMTDAEIAQVRRDVLAQVEDALAFAKQSPFPEPDELMHGVYAP